MLNVMYRVITREKPGAPVRAAVAAAAALALTIAAAWQLTKARTGPLPAGSEITLPHWPFSFAVPSGWNTFHQPEEARGSGRWHDEIAFRSPGMRGAAVHLIVAYHTVEPGTLARECAADLVESRLTRELKLREGDLDAESADHSVFPLAVGPLYGECVRWMTNSFEPDYFVAAASACLPNGRAFSIQALCPAPMGTQAIKAVRTVCQSIRPRPEFKRDPSVTSGGLTCELPTGALAAPGGGDSAAGILLTASADAEFAFQIEVRPTFLVEGRTPGDLLHDYAVNFGRDLTPEIPIQQEAVDNRTAAHAIVPQRDVVSDVRVIDLLDGRAAIVTGHAPPDQADGLDRLCRKVAETSGVLPEAWPYPLRDAAANGARFMKLIASEGVPWLLPEKERSSLFVVESGGDLRGGEETEWTAPDQLDEPWSGRLRHERVFKERIVMSLERTWTISADAGAFTSREEITDNPSAGTSEIITHLTRESADAELEYRVEIADETYKAAFPSVPEYLPDPIIYPAIRAWAVRSQDDAAVFRCVTLSDRELAAMYLRRLAADELPDGVATGVEELMDFVPESRVHYLDEDGNLVHVRSGHTTELRPATARDRLQPFERLLRDMASGRRRAAG